MSIKPEMLTFIELHQQHIDSIAQTVPHGSKNVQDIYPLSPLREWMLFHHVLNEPSDAYVEQLHLERTGRHDNFFEIDGHSLQAIRVSAPIRDVFDVEVPLRVLFEKLTIEVLARHIPQEIAADVSMGTS